MKLKGGALYYSIAVSLIIAILAVLLVLAAYYKRLEFQKISIQNKLITNLKSGLQLIQSDDIEYGMHNLDLFSEGKDSISLIKKTWGLFDVYSVKSFHKHKSFQKSMLAGIKDYTHKNTAFYIADLNKPIAVCGKTRIVGTSFLPKAGIKRAYIEGQNYSGTELVYGETKESKKELPKINKERVKLLQNLDLAPSETLPISILFDAKKINNSFSKPSKIYENPSKIVLSGIDIKGNIAIISKQGIEVKKNCNLGNVLLVAPYIKIGEAFKGNIHIVAKDSIIIQKSVLLEYPSSVALINEKPVYANIAEKTEINGDVLVYGKDEANRKTFLVIEKNCIVYGQVYCNGYVQHKGEIEGSLFCNKLYLKTPSSIYENHLLNASINKTIQNEHYVSSYLFNPLGKKEIAEWLN